MQDLSGAVALHLTRRAAERVSSSYARDHERALRRLLERVSKRLRRKSIPVSAVTREDLLAVLGDLRERGLSDGTINSHIGSFRVFFRDMEERGLLLINPAASLRRLPEDPLPRYVPTQEEMRRLLEIPDTVTERGIRDRAILELLYGSGLRRGELLSLELTDLNLADRFVFIREGKGKKDRVVPITEQAARWIAAYLETRTGSPYRRLFLGMKDDKPLNGTSIYLRLKELFRRAGFPKDMTVHAIRHACALHLLERGADVVAVKNLLGHAKLDTTAIYLRLTTGHLARALAQSHPRG
jgi:integrase/recombinase XerD